MLLVLKSSAEQETALEQFLAEQQDPSSPHYHEWLTPQQFGERFGASQEDLDVIEVPEAVPNLLVQVLLKVLDWVVDSKGRKLTPNPAHGCEQMTEEY